jgi:hypothetical protein
MRKFRVRAEFRKESPHQIDHRSKIRRAGRELVSQRDFEIVADDPDDAKIRVREILKREGSSEKTLEHITWTVSRLDRPRKK